MEQGAVNFQLPDANKGGVVVDLNFFNRDRPGRRMGKRILFDEGTIDIEEVSTTSLRMSFKGSGHPLMDDDTRFPIEGSVTVQGLRVVTGEP